MDPSLTLQTKTGTEGPLFLYERYVHQLYLIYTGQKSRIIACRF